MRLWAEVDPLTLDTARRRLQEAEDKKSRQVHVEGLNPCALAHKPLTARGVTASNHPRIRLLCSLVCAWLYSQRLLMPRAP